MASTTVLAETLAKALGECDPNRLADALRDYGFGMHLSPLKYTLTSSPGATAWVITGATAAAGASAGTKTPALPQNQQTLPPILSVTMLRVITGVSGGQGPFLVTDSGGTPQLLQVAGPSGAQVLDCPGVCLLSDDGTTITFPEQVKSFVIQYISRSLQDVTTLFEHS